MEFLQLFVEFFVALCVPCAQSRPEQHWCNFLKRGGTPSSLWNILSNVKKTLEVTRGATIGYYTFDGAGMTSLLTGHFPS